MASLLILFQVSLSYAATSMNEDSVGRGDFTKQLSPLILNCFSSLNLFS